jgi:hypothetical protein
LPRRPRQIGQQADDAAFARRAAAVDKERAIAENELGNRIELARREANLVEQEGANERRRATEKAAASLIATESRPPTADRRRHRCEVIRVEGERVARSSGSRPTATCRQPHMGLAPASSPADRDHRAPQLTPDLLGTLGQLAEAGTPARGRPTRPDR